MPELDFREYEDAFRRVPHRLYISKSFKHPRQDNARRFARKRFEVGPLKEVLKKGEEFVLHETDTGIQQIRATFLEDGRGITHLHIQRWSTKTGNPMGEQVVLYGEQIGRLIEFIQNIRQIEIPTPNTFNVDEDNLRLVHMPDADALKVLEDHPELVAEFARSQITTEDVVAIAYRRRQLQLFSDMLDKGNDISEGEWQDYFEQNQWIFGYGLSYIFATGLYGKKLQQTIRGSNLIAPGKIPDGIMKTRAAISALCLVEIKKSSTELLKKNPYRAGTWSPSNELSGAVAQCQESLRAASEALNIHHRFTDERGNPTGEELLSVEPRSFLVVGNLGEFRSVHGINSERYQAFEGFRRNLRQPEILTFDELYERARFIVASDQNSDESA